MKSFLILFLSVLSILLGSVTGVRAYDFEDQGNFTLSAGTDPGWYKLTAPTVDGRVYFFQMSSDGMNWAYAPTVKLGSPTTPSEYEFFPVSGQKQFFRLKYTEETDYTAGATGDVDGDTLSNSAEITAGTDPFNPDTDGDGMPDGWELKSVPSLNPLSATDASNNSDNDGLTALQEYQLGTNPRKADTDGDGLNDNVELAAGGDPTKFNMPTLSLMEYSREATLEDWREPTFANRHNWVSTWRNTIGSGTNGSGGTKSVWASPTVPANAQMNPNSVVADFLDENVGPVPPLPAGDPLPWGTAQSTGTTLRTWLRQTWSWESPYRVQRVRVRQSRYFLRSDRAMPMELKVRAGVTKHSRSGYLDEAWTTDGVVESNTLTLPSGQMDSNEITFNPATYSAVTPPTTTDTNPRTVGDIFFTISIQAFPYSPTTTDSDGDGLPNTIEESMGTLSNNVDTDSDGREDYLDFISTRPGALTPTGPRANPSSPTVEEDPLIEYTWRDGHICPSSDFSKKSGDTNIAVHGSHWDFGDKLENVNPAPTSPTQAMKDFWAASPVYNLTLPTANAPPATIFDETKNAAEFLRTFNLSNRFTGGSPPVDSKGGDSKETMFRLRRETSGPKAISRNFLIIDRQKADTTSSTWVYTSVTPQTITIDANQTISPVISVTANPLKLPNEITPPSGKTSIHEIIAAPTTLTISNSQDAPIPVANGSKFSVGAFTVANQNDTDGDGIIDKTNDNDVLGEKDLMPLQIAGYSGLKGKVKLTVKSGSVKFWEQKTKGTEIPLQSSAVFFNLPAAGTGITKTIWIEATAPSTALRDIEIWAGWENENGTLTDGIDKVRATAVWVTHTGTKNTPTDALWPDVQDPMRDTFVNNVQTFGKNFTNSAGVISYVIGFEFTVTPSGIGAESSVLFDVSRQIEKKEWVVRNGAVIARSKNPTFPASDQSNDDANADDESPIPKNNHIYSYDGPGWLSRTVINNISQVIQRYNFKEFPRVSFDSVRPSGNTSQGSRCGNKVDWHVHMWLEGNGSNYIERAGKPNEVGLGNVPIGLAPTP